VLLSRLVFQACLKSLELPPQAIARALLDMTNMSCAILIATSLSGAFSLCLARLSVVGSLPLLT